jgi:MFS family permease
LQRVLLVYFAFNTAEWSTWVAILVYAYEHGGATASAIAAAVQLVPAALLAPLGAVLGDRWPRHRALAFGFALQSTTLGLTAVAIACDAALVIVYAVAATAAASIALTRPVFFAALPTFAGARTSLAQVNGCSTLLEGVAVFVGPMIGGLLLELHGAAAVFAVFSVAQLLAAALVATCKAQPAGQPRVARGPTLAMEFIAGFAALKRQSGVAMLMACVGSAFMLVGITDILAVVLALDVIEAGPSGSGFLIAAMGVGGLVISAACMPLLGKLRLPPVVAIGGSAAGVAYSLAGLSNGLAVAFVLLAISGAGKSLLDIAARTLLQRHVPDVIRARVFGVQEALMQASLAVGSLLVPLLVVGFGVRGAFVAAGLLLPVVAALSWPRLKSMEVPQPALARS